MEENPRSVCGLIGTPRHAIIPRPSPDGYRKLGYLVVGLIVGYLIGKNHLF